MKVTVHGPVAGYGPSGTIESWGPDQLVVVDDSDKKAVAHWRAVVEAGRASMVEDAPAKEPAKTEEMSSPAEPSLADLRAQAEARGLPTYGSKAQLQERLASGSNE